MAEERAQRRLAAILAADVVGYSRLMQLDEAGTLAALKARRSEVLQPVVSNHRGRIVKVMGDGVLVEFASAVDAVECAVRLQEAMECANAGLPEERRIVLRVGVNLGDVMVEGSDLYGDGVNIAARLENLAEPGRVYLSQTVFNHVRGKVPLGFDDLGEQGLKNITEPVRVYRVSGTAAPAAGAVPGRIASPSRLSIAVLPFLNMSGDPEQEYFSDGITEDITTELSRFRSLCVIARNSSFQFRGKALDMKEIGRRLDARYLIEGSVRRAGSQVRITAQLIDATTGDHAWAERYDRNIEDIFSVQEDIAHTIAATLVARLNIVGAAQASRKPPDSLNGYDCLLRGIEYMNRNNDSENGIARRFFEQAISLDPGYGRAYACLAVTFVFTGLREPAGGDLQQAYHLATKAIELDGHDALSHGILGYACEKLGRLEEAGIHLERALELNPCEADLNASMSELQLALGHPDLAIDWIEKAIRLNPFHPSYYLQDRGLALYSARRYADAIGAFRGIVPPLDIDDALLAACYAQLEQHEEAGRLVAKIAERAAPFSTEALITRLGYADERDRAHLREGFRRAGLPA